jgi:hypothetical protein
MGERRKGQARTTSLTQRLKSSFSCRWCTCIYIDFVGNARAPTQHLAARPGKPVDKSHSEPHMGQRERPGGPVRWSLPEAVS